jgi:hypothetical protein
MRLLGNPPQDAVRRNHPLTSRQAASAQARALGGATPAPDPADAWTAARWRRESGRVAAFVGVLCLLEGANWYLLAAAFSWVLPGAVLPGLAALALIVVLVGTILSRSLLANPVLKGHQLRLRITLIGLLTLQFIVNTLEGFDVARTHLPPTAAEFFGLSPIVAARLAGAVLGGSLAIITFSYLLLVAQILEEMLPPPNLQREAEVLLRRFERRSGRASAGSPQGPDPALRNPVEPTVPMQAPDPHDSQTQPATRFWPNLVH